MIYILIVGVEGAGAGGKGMLGVPNNHSERKLYTARAIDNLKIMIKALPEQPKTPPRKVSPK